MTVLVTGATGFTGGHLCRALVRAGHSVRALVRQGSQGTGPMLEGADLHWGDIRDPKAVQSAVQGVDLVYHIAAAFRIAGKPDQYYWDVNVEGTRNVLRAAEASGVKRVVHCSTVGVHGDVGPHPVNEEARFNPGDIYQETKLEGEHLASGAFSNGLPGVVFRPSGIYGPGDRRFLKLFRAIQKRHFIMLGSGEVSYSLTYVEDVVRGALLCGSHPDALGRTFILAGQNITLNELVQLLSRILSVPPPRLRFPLGPVLAAAYVCEAVCRPLGLNPPLYPRRADFFRKRRAFLNDYARRGLGWEPQVGLEDGLARTARWYVQQGWL